MSKSMISPIAVDQSPVHESGECTVTEKISGFVSVTTPSAADGYYEQGVVVSYDFGLSPAYGYEFAGFNVASSPDNGYVAANLFDGQIVGLAVSFEGPDEQSIWLNDGVLNWSANLSHATASVDGTYAVSTVPEPINALLLLFGLAVVGGKRR